MVQALETFDHEAASLRFEKSEPEEIMRWAAEHFGPKLCMSTSFQLGGMVLLDILSKSVPHIPVLFIDTGFHFKETMEFAEKVRERYKLNLKILHPRMGREIFKSVYGDDHLYERNPTECCRINKVEPMTEALKPFQAQIAALRRDSSAERAKIPIIDRRTDGVYMIHPLANWTREQSKKYSQEHNVPVHPLHDQGYKTIGCFPEMCTQKVGENAPERAGRWTGTGKSECGLHLVGKKRETSDFSI